MRVREGGSGVAPRRNPITAHVQNSSGFLHTGFLGGEYITPPVDPRYDTARFGANQPTVLNLSSKKSNLLYN